MDDNQKASLRLATRASRICGNTNKVKIIFSTTKVNQSLNKYIFSIQKASKTKSKLLQSVHSGTL
jgi:hypothetical protein